MINRADNLDCTNAEKSEKNIENDEIETEQEEEIGASRALK